MSDADRDFVRTLVIHDDEAVLAFDKPSGLPVQTRNPDDRTLDSLLAAFAKSNGKRPRLVHRLDAQTSGVILAGKTQPSAAALSAAFAGRDVAKTYLAICAGPPLEAESGVIDVPLSRYKARPELELSRAAQPGDVEAKSAVTLWRVLSSNQGVHLLLVEPQTGRMHQIRAHLGFAARPILGDPYYGGLTHLAGDMVSRLMLHAWRLDFPHPSGGRLTLEAPPPEDFRAILSVAGLNLASLNPKP